jgi:hypothetical protein
MDIVLKGLKRKFVVVYLDDVNVYSNTWEEHLEHLRTVFERFRKAGLRLNMKKCFFAQSSLSFLGFIVSENGIQTDPAKIDKMVNFPEPTNTSLLRGFLGTVGYYRQFIKDFSKIAHPLNLLLRKGKPYEWGPRQQAAFDELKTRVTQAPVLAYPDLTKPFRLYTDASLLGYGALLGQNDDQGRERVISYASRSLNLHERRYSVSELECAAAVWAIDHYRQYVLHQEFDFFTDHQALKYILGGKARLDKLKFQRWALDVQEYRYKPCYIKGKTNRADALSRIPTHQLIAAPAG